MMYLSYTSTVFQVQNVSSFNGYVDSSLNRSRQHNVILKISLTVLILILIVPLAYALGRRKQIHEKIFDLIVSI
jgi:hypothetical protein